MDSSPACVSFIGIVDFTENATWVYCSESVQELLGYEPHELIGTSSLLLVHPDEFSEVKELHYTTISQDQAAVLAYLRMKHKDPYKGYILCGISRTVCQSVLVGSVSFAAPGPKAMHNASTAQEVKIITPTAKDLEFRRWNDPNPMPPCPIPSSRSASPDPKRRDRCKAITFAPLPEQSVRTALILDRFSVNCNILYCSNDSLISTTVCMGRSFFDFVSRKDEDLVRSWIDVIKSWGVNERGQPSDGGFGFGKFNLVVRGRDSSNRQPDPVPSRHRNGTYASHAHGSNESHSHSRTRDARASYYSPSGAGAAYRDRERDRDRYRESRPAPRPRAEDERVVDAIFSAHSDGLMVILRPSSTGHAAGERAK